MTDEDIVHEEVVTGNVRWLRPRPRPKPELDARGQLIEELSAPAVKSVRLTSWIAIGVFAVLLALAAFAPITSGVVAPGQLATQLARQEVQHPTGGIVKQILVREGDHVAAGQTLIKLEPLEASAAAAAVAAQLESLKAASAVRGAELGGESDVALPAAADAESRSIVAAQKSAFEARKARNDIERRQVDEQRAQIRAELGGARAEIAAERTQIEGLQKELGAYNRLLEAGLVEKTRVWATERSIADMQGRLAASQADLARLHAQDRELAAKAAAIDADAKVKAAEDLGDIQRDLAATSHKYDAVADALRRTDIVAPVSGSVMRLTATTVGGVIKPADTIMEIVPDKGELIVLARINPKDADDVRAGAAAVVRFDSLGGRYAPRLKAKVISISADTLNDPRTGAPYFEARVAVPPSETRRLPSGAFEPGVPAEVLIKTGQQTLFAYLLGPIDRTAFRAMRDK